MKKLLAIVTFLIITLSSNNVFACDNWPNCTFSNDKVVEKTNKTKKSKNNKVYIDNSTSTQSGMASYYWQPQAVACGGRFNPEAMTAAHKSYPCGTRVMVTNKNNGKSVVVTINDRGPFVAGRVIDLSKAAARAINMIGAGVAPVTLSKM